MSAAKRTGSGQNTMNIHNDQLLDSIPMNMFHNNFQSYEQTFMQKVLKNRIGQEIQNITNPNRTGFVSEYIITARSDS
jgi:hypothetical protein